MPPGRSYASGLRVPRLDGVGQSASIADELRIGARLARAMIDAGVTPRREIEGDISAFMAGALDAWVRRHGAAVVDRRLELAAVIVPTLDPYLNEHLAHAAADPDDMPVGCFLAFDAQSAHMVNLGPAIDWLGAVHPQLPRTIEAAFVEAQTVMRMYGRWEANEYFDQRLDGMDEEDLKNMEVPPRAVPTVLHRRPLGERAVAELRNRWPSDVRDAVDRALEVSRLGKAFGRIRPRYDRAIIDVYSDMGMPVPAMVIAIEEHDFIHAAFDDESQYMLELQPEPNVWWMLKDITAAEVRTAFDGLASALEVLAATVRLVDALPTKRVGAVPRRQRVRVHAGRPLMEVLLEDEDGMHELVGMA